MEIEEMQKQREAFEVRLRNVASEIVDEFQRRTGLMVTGVYIDLTQERTIGATRGHAIVTSARLSIEL